jgi:hypothetical protein
MGPGDLGEEGEEEGEGKLQSVASEDGEEVVEEVGKSRSKDDPRIRSSKLSGADIERVKKCVKEIEQTL